MVTLYNVVSQDGFITRPDGSEDFIPDKLWPKTLEFFKQFDLLVMGRKTYEVLQEYSENLLVPFEQLDISKVIVTKDINFLPRMGYEIANSPEEALRMRDNVVVSSGPTLNNYLLEHNLVDKIVLHRISKKIGNGIKPYDVNLTKLAPDYMD